MVQDVSFRSHWPRAVGRTDVPSFRGRRVVWAVVAGALLGLFILSRSTGWLVEWLWMRALGYEDVFVRLLGIKLLLSAAAMAVSFFYLWGNLALAGRNILTMYGASARDGIRIGTPMGNELRIGPGWLRAPPVIVAAVVSLSFAGLFYTEWDAWLRFRYGGAFGLSDPLFQRDVGFYVFRYPFLDLLQGALTALTFLALVLGALSYVVSGAIRRPGGVYAGENRPVRTHLVGLLLPFIAAWGWGYYLDRFGLLFSTRGVVHGAGYTDVNVVRIGLWVMLAATAALAVVAAATAFRRRFGALLAAGGAYAALIAIVLIFLPSAIQQFQVKPNELQLETPYLERNIDFTRRAYRLDRVQTRAYRGLSNLTYEQARRNGETLKNIRLWDWRPLGQTYRQTQEIRAYYKFYEVDVDRYRLEGDGYRQVMLSARELEDRLPESARTWVNEHLQYTHGYGLAMSLVAEKTDEGLPVFLIKDLPPQSVPGLEVTQPAIYYGEKTPGYRIVATEIRELDYPKGDNNVYTSYSGRGGILLGGWFRRLLFAWNLADANILLSDYLTPTSRVQLWRRTQERVSRVAPFLRLDEDPYLVLSEGKLYWIQDAYTVTSRFPYSESYRGAFNYIRNSVKVVVDAYDGSVKFYVADPVDPVLRMYRSAFPGMFKELKEMSADLRTHLRYPEGLFGIQVQMYKTYHMTRPQVFYNKEDLWTVPNEKYAGNTVPMDPYYVLVKLPGEEKLEYLIMTPMTPSNRDNMIAWVAGKCDLPDYGEMIAFELPKERLIYGPLQIEAMIDQDDVISQQLSLWDQRGSRVIRGNLVVIPLDHSFLYVEPVYLIAEETNIPQLRRVIVVYGKKVSMQPTLEGALRAVFGAAPAGGGGAAASPPRSGEAPGRTAPALREARQLFERAEDALRNGKWEAFGRAMEALGAFLRRDKGNGGP
jgi:uncharacterized protein